MAQNNIRRQLKSRLPYSTIPLNYAAGIPVPSGWVPYRTNAGLEPGKDDAATQRNNGQRATGNGQRATKQQRTTNKKQQQQQQQPYREERQG
jgi:hypothetical protein